MLEKTIILKDFEAVKNFVDISNEKPYDIELLSGKYIVNAQKFNQTIKVMTGEEITLNIDQKFSACISCGKSSHKMTALDSEIFPMIFDLKSDRSFVVSQSVIKKMINQVSFAMGVNDPRTVLNGCYTQIRDDSITFVACDSYKLAKVSKFINIENRNTNNDAHLNFNFIIKYCL